MVNESAEDDHNRDSEGGRTVVPSKENLGSRTGISASTSINMSTSTSADAMNTTSTSLRSRTRAQ